MTKQTKVKLYAKALAEVLLEESASAKAVAWQGKVINNFMKLLVKDGYEKKAKEILSLAEDFLLEKQGKRKITFQTARKITTGQKKILQSFAKEGDIVKEEINFELIAGVKIIINNNKQFDASLNGKLQKIF
jgi:F0F1-type ATP synthase delta subunit